MARRRNTPASRMLPLLLLLSTFLSLACLRPAMAAETEEIPPAPDAPPLLLRQHAQAQKQEEQQQVVIVNEDGSLEEIVAASESASASAASTSTSEDTSPFKSRAEEEMILTEEDVQAIVDAMAYEPNDRPSMQDKALMDMPLPMMQRFITGYDGYRSRLSKRGLQFPFSGITEFFVAAGVMCPTLQFLAFLVTTNPPSMGLVTKQKHPENPDGTLPHPLHDLKGFEGDFIPDSVIKEEKKTYYFYYRVFETLYSYALDGKPEVSILDPAAPGWYNQRVHFRNATSFFGQVRETPYAMTLQKEGHVLQLFRGTMYQDEWQKDFTYRLSPPEATAPYFDGRVHRGMFELFLELLPHLMSDIESRNPTHITLFGHSLGGVIMTYLGAYLGKIWGHKNIQIDVITTGTFAPGDEAFWNCARKYINIRNLRFLGEGWVEQDGEKMYTLGDVVAQSPGGSVPTCPFVEGQGGSPTEMNDFWTPGSTVAFYPSNLRNTKAWRIKSNWANPRRASVTSTHKCSYICWLAEEVGEPEHRCYFPDQQPSYFDSLLGRGGPRLKEEEICAHTYLDPADFDLSRDARFRGRAPSAWGQARV